MNDLDLPWWALFNNLSNSTRANGTATFPDGKPQALLQRYRVINSTFRFTLSPGITISTPSGNDDDPVTSVVRK